MDFMDCHALLRKARNDNKNKDSRIVELESWLFKPRKEDKT